MPEADDYRTALDGQPLNENGTQSGDRADLFEWVLAQEEAGCDRYILSVDQLLSGGLVNSRAMAAEEPVVLSDGRTLGEMELLEELIAVLAADEDNRVWLLDTVMRLAATTGYGGFGLNEYNALRAYGMAPRPHLTGAELTVESIAADYPPGGGRRPGAGGGGGPPAGGGRGGLSGCPGAEAPAQRRPVPLLGGDGGGPVPGAHRHRRLVGGGQHPEKTRSPICGACSGRGTPCSPAWTTWPSRRWRSSIWRRPDGRGPAPPSGTSAAPRTRPACAYDYQPLETIMAEHFAFFGLTEAEPGACALNILVLTQPADEAGKADYIGALIEELNRDRAVPAILIDAGNGAYGTAFHEALTEETELGRLLSYAGFLDMAIVTGTALSHGVARYAFLQSGERTEAAERAFLRTVADSVLKDFCYKNIVRNDILNFVRGDLQGNADNFWTPDIDRKTVLARLEAGMEAAAAPVIANLERSNFIASLDPYAERGWGGVELTNYRFPWDRAFEIGMDIQLGEFTEPHESVLGVYYK